MTTRLVSVIVAVALVAAACSDNGDTASSDTTTTDPAVEAEPIEQLRILHPKTLAFSAPFELIDPTGGLADVASAVSTSTWATPDVLRSELVNGNAEVAAVPTNVGANLANRDVDVRMVAVLVWGLLWLVGPDGAAGDWEDLRGETVMVPFRNDMPDLVFRYLAEENGLTPDEDFTIDYYAQPPEIAGQLIAGTGKWAVLPEHLATVVLARAGEAGQSLERVLDLQEEWADATGFSARIPQAGIVMPGALVDERPDVIAAVLDELERSVAQVNEASDEVTAALAESSGLDAALVADLIPRLNLEVVAGGEAREELERFFTELETLSPDIIGGGLPDGSFYAPDPR